MDIEKQRLISSIKKAEQKRDKALQDMGTSLFESVSAKRKLEVEALNDTLKTMYLKYNTLFK